MVTKQEDLPRLLPYSPLSPVGLEQKSKFTLENDRFLQIIDHYGTENYLFITEQTKFLILKN